VDGPSPWQYYFICPPQMLETARVKAFRDWVFEEVGRFKQLFERACEMGPTASADLTADALRATPHTRDTKKHQARL
jgi:LysR family glycine cleavage system transcriptional activator